MLRNTWLRLMFWECELKICSFKSRSVCWLVNKLFSWLYRFLVELMLFLSAECCCFEVLSCCWSMSLYIFPEVIYHNFEDVLFNLVVDLLLHWYLFLESNYELLASFLIFFCFPVYACYNNLLCILIYFINLFNNNLFNFCLIK